MANEGTILNPEGSNEQNEQINEPTEAVNETEVKAEAEATQETATEQTPPEENKAEQEVKEEPGPVAEEAQKEEAAPEAKEEPKAAETPKEEAAPEAKEEPVKDEKAEKLDAAFAKLKELKASDEKFEVTIKSRIRGGLRAFYDEFPLFLPVSHFSLKRNPSEDEMASSIEQTVSVKIHEIQEEDGRRTVLVSRKKILETEFWSSINVGDKVEGVVSSVAPFGVFLNLGGAEGLIHISRLSQVHVDDPNNFAKKGEKMEAVIVEIDKEKNRIALSRKELEDSPWEGIEGRFPAEMICKGIVKRLTDFGAYVELEPGVDGLLRTNEMDWTRRIKNPAEMLKPNQEIDVYIIASNEKKQTVALSLKRTSVSPWPELASEYEVGKEVKGVVSQVMDKGMLVTLDGRIDGFMPRSKMSGLKRGQKIPYNTGDDIQVLISDFDVAEESLILAMQGAGDSDGKKSYQGGRGRKRENFGKFEKKGTSAFSFADLLSKDSKQNLMDNKD